MNRTANLRWYYNERHHGKGPTDGVGGSIKNRVYRYAMSYKCVIKSAKEFPNYANKVVKGITSLYLPEDDLLTEVDDIEEALKKPEMLSIHMLVRNFKEDSICFIQFFNFAVDIEPFFTQSYRIDGDPEVFGYELLPLNYFSNLCFLERQLRGQNEQWFHELYFLE